MLENETVSSIHDDRMPVIAADRAAIDAWLDPHVYELRGLRGRAAAANDSLAYHRACHRLLSRPGQHPAGMTSRSESHQ